MNNLDHFCCRHCRYLYEDAPLFKNSKRYKCALKSKVVWDPAEPGPSITYCSDRQQLAYIITNYNVDNFLEGDP